jgi:hypothetical protein
VRGIKGNNALARGSSTPAFNTFSYPTPAFDDLIKNPQVKAALAKQGMSVQQARAEYAKSAPKEITLYADVPTAGRGNDSANKDPLEDKARQGAKGKIGAPQLRKEIGKGAMSKAEFFSKVRGLGKKAKRRPNAVKNARKGGRMSLKKPKFQRTVRAPQPPKAPGLKRQASAADENEVKALRGNKGNPVLKGKPQNLKPGLKPSQRRKP